MKRTPKASKEVKEYLSAISKLASRADRVKAGKARAEALTPERRKEIARKAAAKRWEGRKK